MPDNQSRIHKIEGNTGERIWTRTIDNTAGFGITVINDSGRSDYIVSGGIGSTQERWVARLNGNDGSTMWSKTYNSPGDQYKFDAVRMTIVGSDGYLYGAGFIEGDEPGTIFVVYGGKAVIIKIDPGNGNEIWTHSNLNSAYALAVVEASDIWNGWVLTVDWSGNITRSNVYCQDEVNTATEYGCLIDNGVVIFNDTDAQGDTEVGVMKIIYGSNTTNIINTYNKGVQDQIATIFPNPATTENIYIQIADIEGDINIKTTDIYGRLIASKDEYLNGSDIIEFPISHMVNGTYIISISSDNFRNHQKLIIKQ